jgi:chemotaxis protein histidine kinase CheA
MRRASLSLPLALVGTALLCTAGPAQALGFGRSINASYLGQPLNFAATVRLETDETLPRECVAAEVQSGDNKLPSAALRITVEPGANANERLIRVSTQTQIDEPVVTVTVTAGCLPRLTRSFVTLMDPPGLNLAQGGAAVPEVSLPAQRVDADVAPVVSVVQAAQAASAPARARAPAASDARPARPRAVTAPTPAPRQRNAAAPAATVQPRERKAAAPVAVAKAPGSRLQLEAGTAATLTATAASAAAARAAAAPAMTASAAAAAEMAAASAVQAVAAAASAASAAEQRVALLEEQLRALREDSKKTQQALATLQSSLNEAQASRYSNPLVYGLAWLSALLALAVAALWWRQSQSRQSSQWWLAPSAGSVAQTQSVKPVATRAPTSEAAAARQETQPAVMDERNVVRTIEEESSGFRTEVLDAPATLSPMVAEAASPRRELSVEELIDLEQQADFFVVLGQDDAAIDLLMGHVRSSGGVSPLPYLKLLEIYRRRGEHDSYERVRERFNRRFSAYAPDWDSDLQHGRTLDDYPQVLRQLQRLWDEPQRVTQMLDATLMRQDAEGETYDLPAYRELLFLYSIARDLAEHPSNARAVDLLLPMDGEAAEKPIEQLTASRLMGFAATDQLTVQVDLDVTRPMTGKEPPASDFLGLVDPKLKRGDADRG